MQQLLHSGESNFMRNSSYRMGLINQFEVCRLCLCTSTSLTDIFDVDSNHGNFVKETVEDLLKYKVIRLNGCPWLTCDNCREKLKDFHRFKINCLESKMAFESRFPQKVFLMAEKINTFMKPSQQPQTYFLLPVTDPPAAVGSANNTFQVNPPSHCEALTPTCDQLFANGNGPKSNNEQHLEVDESLRAEACKENENLLIPKLESIVIEPAVGSIDFVDEQSGILSGNDQLSMDVFKAEMEETDVQNVMPQESSIEPSVGCEGDRTTVINLGETGGHKNGLINHENSDPRREADSITLDMEKLPTSIVLKEESLDSVRDKGNVFQISSGEQGNWNIGHPISGSLSLQVKSFSSGELENANFTPVDEPGTTDLPSTVEGGLVMEPAICNGSSDLENISRGSGEEVPVCSIGEFVSKCLSNSMSNSQGMVHPECKPEIPQLSDVGKHVDQGGKLGVRDVGQTNSAGMEHYECALCYNKFKKYDLLISHMLFHSGDPRPYKCPMCPKTFKNRKTQMRHHKSHYNVPQRFECQVCKAEFKCEYHLKRHMGSHTISGFPCKICGQVFKYSQLRSRHMAQHSGRKFSCPDCDKAFFLKHELAHHQLAHSNEKSFQCNVCGKGFNKPQYLRTHLHLHDEVKRHICPECGAKFAQYSALWQHRKLHQDRKKFVCEVCDKGFALNCQLTQHKKVHTKTLNRVSEKTNAITGMR